MVSGAIVTASVPADPPEACPFCGQPLLSTRAVDHLAGQTSAYEARQRKQAQAEVEKQVAEREATFKVETAAALKTAAEQRAREVAELARRLDDLQTNQDALVQAEVDKQVAVSEELARARLLTEFAKRESQLRLTLKKLEEQNNELSRRVEGLSAGDRGEFNEDEIAVQLTSAFPDDEITRTRRGQRGADIFQRVRFRSNGELIEAGLIIYECKDTLQWSNRFVEQIRAQAKLHGTPYAVLVSRRFPQGSSSLVVLDDIVVIEPGRCVALAQIVRRMAIESYRAGIVAGSQAGKTAELFRFISSMQFRQAFDSLSESIDSLDGLLTRERQGHLSLPSEN